MADFDPVFGVDGTRRRRRAWLRSWRESVRRRNLRPIEVHAFAWTAVGGRSRPDVGLEVALAGVCAASLGAASIGFASEEVPSGPILCPFRLATGIPCPFCGLTRSVFAAGQGLWTGSLEHNVLGPLVLVLAAVLLPLSVNAVLRRKPLRWPRSALGALVLVLMAGWAINLGLGGPRRTHRSPRPGIRSQASTASPGPESLPTGSPPTGSPEPIRSNRRAPTPSRRTRREQSCLWCSD